MRRQESPAVKTRNILILERIKELKTAHPFWGYRRIWAQLKFGEGVEVNKKRIYRLMGQNGLLVKPGNKLKATRTPQASKPRPTRPNQWWGIDMTKVMVEGYGWMYLVVVLDWYTKKIVGYYLGLQCRSTHWLEALDMAVNQQFPEGVKDRGLCLMSDNGSQPTSLAFMKACREMGIRQAFTSYGNPKGNADTERNFRTMKEELFWLQEWTSPFELVEATVNWIRGYNRSYLHSALGYKAPEQFENEYTASLNTQLVIA